MRLPYLPVFAVAGAAVFWVAVALHDLRGIDLTLLVAALRADGRVVLFGNSINRTVSHCDADRRTLPELLAVGGARSVLNLSRGGMTLAPMLRIAEVTVAAGLRPAAFVFPITFSELLRPATERHGWQGFVHDNRLPLSTAAEAAPIADPGVQPYKGRRYGSYGEIAATYFPRERRDGGCPEGPGIDRAFVEFMYWRNYLQPTDVRIGLDDTLRRASALRSKGVAVAFWIPPVDLEDIAALHGEAATAALLRRVDVMASAIAGSGFTVFDTSNGMPAEGFADRWCACGHLNEAGRSRLALKLAADLMPLERPALSRPNNRRSLKTSGLRFQRSLIDGVRVKSDDAVAAAADSAKAAPRCS